MTRLREFSFFFPAGSSCVGASQPTVLIWDVICPLLKAHTVLTPAQDCIWVWVNPNHYLTLQIFFWPDWELCWAVHWWFSLAQETPPKCFWPCQWALIFWRQKARTSLSQQVSWPPAGPDALLKPVIFIVSLFPSVSGCKLLIMLPGLLNQKILISQMKVCITTYLLNCSQNIQNIFLLYVSKNDCYQIWQQVVKKNCSMFLYVILDRGYGQIKPDLHY